MLKKMSTTVGVLAVLAGQVLTIGAAHAASVSATASIIDRTSSLLSFSNDQFLSDASTPFQSGFDAGSVLQNYYFNTTAGNGNTSYAQIDNSSAPFPQTSAGAGHDGKGSATVSWSFDWLATGTGTATLDLQYLYSATVLNIAAGETGKASSFVSVLLDGTHNIQEALYFFNNVNGNTSGINDLVLNFGVNAGDKGTFTVTTASNAIAASVVPIPAAVWLLGSALTGLAGFTRRKPNIE